MRYDENKSFPYPVLREGSEDYVEGAFQTTIKYALTRDLRKIHLKASFLSSEPAIQKLLKTKKAKYCLLVESRDTYFRDLITTSKTHIEKEFAGAQIKGPVTILPYIVAVKDVKKFTSPNFNPEYSKKSFEIVSGDVLALDQPREFYVGQEVFAHIGTVFELVEEDGLKDGEIKLNLEDEKVQLRVNSDQKKKLDIARTQKKNRSILLSGIYLPALMQVLKHMSDNPAEFEEKKWFRSIKWKCDLAKIELTDDTDLLSVAQKLLAYPLKKMTEQHFGGQ